MASLAASKGARDASGNYKSVGGSAADADAEKTQWLQDEAVRRKRRKWLTIGVIGIIVIAAIVGGSIGAVITTRKINDKYSSAEDTGPELTLSSKSIKAILNNPNLHKVFPGMDYTPLNAQYPDCIHNPPVQNNVTKDIAVLSQLTPEIRLYGTDCNQTEMVLHAIDILDIASDFKVWLGVWQDGNETTNTRQLQQMYNVLDSTTRADSISGVVVGNEVLFSKYMTEDELINVISSVRSNLTSRGLQVPVATSDLGSNWSKSLAAAVDVVMANVHPFFGGVAAPDAAAWTWSFWQNEDVALTQGTSKKHVISEVGWPSAGGNDCGTGTKCADSTSGSVAGVDEMNQFMNDWVCQSLQNQTSYFWFETFDEPWKVRYNSPGEEWEDKWGLMDVNRNIKKGLKIPDCGGQTAGPTTWPAPMAST
ncbi:hypothetical protein FH972_025640 [Carpinus fangiana]|uniref:glucan endo-1,3-beta-D-glucosidase n=1 Tax=Carpinus fangiana TaxID=176857 RepID=A0A5N6L1K9_9ROSI|nr:hypothetical protein FH972_025640 [Carpinus fangiana]